jgi:NADPH:quinone reductase
MRALQFTRHGGPEVLQMADVQTPSVDAGTVLIGNQFVGVNYVDTMFREGKVLIPVLYPSSRVRKVPVQ